MRPNTLSVAFAVIKIIENNNTNRGPTYSEVFSWALGLFTGAWPLGPE